jgi:predicted regulator of Ras-like GTPase activity (Roadblock/LC7/MglB family)
MNTLKAELAKKKCLDVLADALSAHAESEFFCLGLVDGRAWAYQGPPEFEAARLAAMTTSALALSEAFAKEVRFGRLRYSVHSLDTGVIVTVRVPCASRLFALSCGFGATETVAMALRIALNAAERIAVIIDAAGLTVARTETT